MMLGTRIDQVDVNLSPLVDRDLRDAFDSEKAFFALLCEEVDHSPPRIVLKASLYVDHLPTFLLWIESGCRVLGLPEILVPIALENQKAHDVRGLVVGRLHPLPVRFPPVGSGSELREVVRVDGLEDRLVLHSERGERPGRDDAYIPAAVDDLDQIRLPDLGADLDRAIKEMITVDKPVLFDCVVDPKENCFPMIPSGRAHNEMLLGDAGVAVEDAITEEGKVMV